jgi:hypothetical protein
MNTNCYMMLLGILVVGFVVGMTYPAYCGGGARGNGVQQNNVQQSNVHQPSNADKSAMSISGNRHTISVIPKGTIFPTSTSQACPSGYHKALVAGNIAFVPDVPQKKRKQTWTQTTRSSGSTQQNKGNYYVPGSNLGTYTTQSGAAGYADYTKAQ